MIDLTPAFQSATARNVEWSYEKAKALAHELAGASTSLEVSGGANENWLWVREGERTAAIVYQPLALVIAQDDLIVTAGDVLADVTVVPGLPAYDAVAFRFDKEAAAELLPYPVDEIDLEWNGFSAWDFAFETL